MTILRSAALILFLSAVPALAQGFELSNGSAQSFNLQDKNVVNGSRGYIVNVTASARRLEIRMVATNCEADVDLFVSYGTDVTAVSHDFTGQGSANTKIVVVTPNSGNPLREGTYYIGLQLKSDAITTGTLFVTIDNDNSSRETVLASGAMPAFSFGCVQTTPFLFNGPFSYRVTVPAGATSLVINVASPTTGARIDVYANPGTDVAGTSTSVQATFRAEGAGANKTLTILNPQAGTYFIAMRLVLADVIVTGTISPTIGTPVVIGLTTTSLTFNAPVNSNPPGQPFTIRNAGAGTLNFLIAKTQPWLTVTPDRGPASSTGVAVTVSINATGLSAGTFSDILTISDQGIPPAPSMTVRVTLNLTTGPGISVTPTLDFGTVTVGQPKDLPLSVRNTGTANLTVNSISSSNAQFTVVSPGTPFNVAAGSEQAAVIRFQPSAAGAQSTTLTITSNAATVTVALTGSGQGQAGPTISASTTSLSFNTQAGSNPQPQTFTVRNGGSGTLAYQITTDQPWLAVAPATGSSTSNTNTHSASVNTSSLTTGTFDGQIRIAPGTGAGLSADGVFQAGVVVIAVRLTITAGSGPTPTVSAGGIVNAASFVAAVLPGGSIARGSIFAIFGSNTGPAASPALSFPLATTLGGVSVRVTQGGSSVDAIPLFVGPAQINAILPSNTPLGDVNVTVTFNGRSSAPVRFKVVDTSFGIFTVNGTGFGPGIVTNFVSATDQPVNSTQRTARPRQAVTLWGTGLGPINAPDNTAPPVGTLPVAVDIFVGGKLVTNKLYAGRGPCCAGLDQLVFEIPADAPPGCFVPVFVRAGNVTSNVVTMAINADGQPCSDPANPLGTITQRGGRVGVITLLRAGVRAAIAGQTLDITLDVGTASFTSSQASEFTFNPLTSLPPLGTCTAFSANVDLSGVLGGQLPNVPLPTVRNLDAGAALTITGTAGTRTLPKDASSGTYSALIGSTFPLPGQPSQPLFLNPGAFTITGPGGADVGRFTANLTLPATANWTNRDRITTIDRSQGVTLTWSGGDPATQAATIVGANVDSVTNAAGVFVCLAPLAAGTFTVPSPILSVLPPSNIQQPDESVGILAFLVSPTGNLPTFTAPGLDAGVAAFSSVSATTVTFR